MTARGNKYRSKKPLETSLGQAPAQRENDVDLSHVQMPIHTSIFGIKEILTVYQTGTEEVKNYLSYECDILYECRICRTIFRSLANFILHKRKFCKGQFSHLSNDFLGCSLPNVETVVVEEDSKSNDEDSRSGTPSRLDSNNKKDVEKNISPVVDSLLKSSDCPTQGENAPCEDLYQIIENNVDFNLANDVFLQKIDTSNSAVFQTFNKGFAASNGIKSEVMEIHGLFDSNEVVLGSDGKICSFETDQRKQKLNIPKQDLTCTECGVKFSTKKTLTSHIKHKHNKTCIVYPCPDCQETFANPWGVYRHLFKVHRRTPSQVKKMRAQIHSSAIPKDQEPVKKTKRVHQVKVNEENEWMANFEDDKDLQMCGGCGRRFERKAALHSHSQTCTKRIAVCNAIKENGIKSKTVDLKAKSANKVSKSVEILKGAAKRKPNFTKKTCENVRQKDFSAYSDNAMGFFSNDTTTDKVQSDVSIKFPTTISKKMSSVEDPLKIEGIDENDSQRYGIDFNTNSKVLVKTDCENNMIETVEISDISDESCELVADESNQTKPGDNTDDSQDTDQKKKYFSPSMLDMFFDSNLDRNPENSVPPKTQQKRKRAASCDFTEKRPESTMTLVGPNIDCFSDKGNETFVARVLPYIRRKELKCISCDTTYASFYQLLWHMSLHFSWFRFQCSKCSFMSFNKSDCATHCYIFHDTPNYLLQSTVLPIPKWKIMCMAHNFTELHKIDITNRNCPRPVLAERGGTICSRNNKTDNENEPSKSDQHIINVLSENCDVSNDKEYTTTNNVQIDIVPETIILEDDDDKKIANCKNEAIIELDDDTDTPKEITKKVKIEASSSRSPPSIALNRPVRNRTKSVKTLQDDFIYDIGKALKLNDNSTKSNGNSKHKKLMPTKGLKG